MNEQMFCFQCQETANGSGCTQRGVCGKQPNIANYLDLLLFATRGLCVVSTALRQAGATVPTKINQFVSDALFTTITNTNFNEGSILKKIQRGFALRDQLFETASSQGIAVPDVDEVRWNGNVTGFAPKSRMVGVLRHSNADVRSLHEIITYGLKGIAAYQAHARNLGFEDEHLDEFVQRTISDLCSKRLSIDDLFGMVLETGDHGVQAMALLDHANTSCFGIPEATRVNLSVGKLPGILVSGHDLHDLKMLLDQTRGKGVDIYTHGEMLPANYYPKFRRYPHLHGNYGSSWWHQREEFASFNGPILLTSNCLVPVVDGCVYQKRIFTTNNVSFPGCQHIAPDNDGYKDFSELIDIAKYCLTPKPIHEGFLIGGFAHQQMERYADQIIQAIQKGKIRKFIVMAGCDGRQSRRDYYTRFAQELPKDCIILTAGCAKYRYNMLNLGEIEGIPRVLDAGQCNDSYSLVITAIMLRNRLGLKNINQLPIVFNIAWYEQKAVIVLLALLSLGIKNIVIGPTLPAFISQDVWQKLVKQTGISGNLPRAEEI